MLLARGRPELDDLSQGEETLRAGVERTRSAYALTQLDGTELTTYAVVITTGITFFTVIGIVNP